MATALRIRHPATHVDQEEECPTNAMAPGVNCDVGNLMFEASSLEKKQLGVALKALGS